eukprot:g82.t1
MTITTGTSAASSSTSLRKRPFEYALESKKYRNVEFGELGTQFTKGKLRDDVNEITDRSERWASDTDKLSLHDDSSSVQLSGAINAGDYVTGLAVALRGKKTSKTSPFMVEEVCLPGVPPRNTLSKIKKADAVFAALGKFVSVDILPGFRDTHAVSFPLERPAPMLFPESAQSANVQGVPSPYDARVGDLRVLGHAGEPTDDILRCSSLPDTFAALKLTLQARHLAPTCPDTLNCASFKDIDPLLLHEAPGIYFAGNQAEAKAQRFGETTLLCVPDLRKQAALVLVNMADPTDVCVELLEWN